MAHFIAPHTADLAKAGTVIHWIFDLLDTEGDRSSCSDSAEPIIFAEIPLLDHTLTVASIAIEGIRNRGS